MVTARPNGFIEPCIPTRAVKPPAGTDWVHEIKHDGGMGHMKPGPALRGRAAPGYRRPPLLKISQFYRSCWPRAAPEGHD